MERVPLIPEHGICIQQPLLQRLRFQSAEILPESCHFPDESFFESSKARWSLFAFAFRSPKITIYLPARSISTLFQTSWRKW